MTIQKICEIPAQLLEALLQLSEKQLADVHKFTGERLVKMRGSARHTAIFPDEKTDIVFLIGHLVGITTVSNISMTSRLQHRLVRSVISALCDLLPPKIYVCGGFSNQGESLNTVENFCPAQGIWEAQPSMQDSRGGCVAVAVDQCLYVLGGISGGRALRSVEAFSAQSREWQSLPPMRLARWDSAAVALGGKIYICGGCSGSSTQCIDVLDAVDCFEVAHNLWTILPPLPSPRTGCVATSTTGAVYVQGGRQTCRLNRNLTTSIFGDLLRFHPARGQWEHLHGFLSTVLPKQFGSMAIASDRDMFVFGGEDWKSISDSVFRINLRGVNLLEQPWESWETLPRLAAPRRRGAAVSVDGLIYIFGGENQAGHAISKVEVYDPSEEHQRVVASEMPSIRSGCAAAVLRS